MKLRTHIIHIIMVLFSVILCAVAFGNVIRNSPMEDLAQLGFNFPLLGLAENYDIWARFLAFCSGRVFDAVFLGAMIAVWCVMAFWKYKEVANAKNHDAFIQFLSQSIKAGLITAVAIITVKITQTFITTETFSTIYQQKISDLFPYLSSYKAIVIDDAFPSDHATVFCCLWLVVGPILSQCLARMGMVLLLPALIARISFGFHSPWDMIGSLCIVYFIVAFFSHPERQKMMHNFCGRISKKAFGFLCK